MKAPAILQEGGVLKTVVLILLYIWRRSPTPIELRMFPMPLYIGPQPPLLTWLLPGRIRKGVDVPTQSPTDDGPDSPIPTSYPIFIIQASLSKTAHRPWELLLGLGIVGAVSVSRAAASFPELTGR